MVGVVDKVWVQSKALEQVLSLLWRVHKDQSMRKEAEDEVRELAGANS